MKILLLFVLSRFALATDFCSGELPFNSHYKDVANIVKSSGEVVANSKVIASQADKILSKLLSAKSPLVLNWIVRNKLDPSKDEELIVKKWREYFLESFILAKYPSSEPEINRLIENSFQKISNIAFTTKIKSLYNSLFVKAVDNSKKYILKSTLSSQDKEKTLSKLNSIKLYWYEGLSNTKYEKMPLEFLRWGLAYDPIPNEINIGVLALSYNSDEEIYASLLHEIAHSFDPCRWSAMIGGKNPFDNVITCLRSDKSTGAKPRDDSRIDELVKMNKLPKEVAISLKDNPTCNRSFYPLVGMQRDQIAEVFADWFSAEVIGSFSNEYINKNLRRDLCRKSNLSKGSSYISNTNRLNKIYFTNPSIRKKLSLKEKFKYCSL
jgi:hypothetical protein